MSAQIRPASAGRAYEAPPQLTETGVARTGGRERHSHVQIDHRHATLARPLRRSVG